MLNRPVLRSCGWIASALGTIAMTATWQATAVGAMAAAAIAVADVVDDDVVTRPLRAEAPLPTAHNSKHNRDGSLHERSGRTERSLTLTQRRNAVLSQSRCLRLRQRLRRHEVVDNVC